MQLKLQARSIGEGSGGGGTSPPPLLFLTTDIFLKFEYRKFNFEGSIQAEYR